MGKKMRLEASRTLEQLPLTFPLLSIFTLRLLNQRDECYSDKIHSDAVLFPMNSTNFSRRCYGVTFQREISRGGGYRGELQGGLNF